MIVEISGDWCKFSQDADEYIQEIADSVLHQVEALENRSFSIWKAIKYKTQCDIDGVNYKIKVFIGESSYIHIKVSQPNSQINLRYLEEVEKEKKLSDKL